MPFVESEAADLARMRRRYVHSLLREQDMAPDPFAQFRAWLAEAVRIGLPEPNAMVLATADRLGQPSSRHVLLKELDDQGFVFFTNYGSRKAADIADNPRASLCFPWFAMGRQVIVEGEVERVARAESEAYWRIRPRDAQLGAWASQQSAVIPSRDHLEARVAEMEHRFPGEVPLPDTWGGYRIIPISVEFWQGNPARLHDRLRYRRADPGWGIERLAP